MDLFDIAAKISLNTKDFENGLQGANEQGKTFADKLKSGLGTAAKVGGAAIAAIGTGAVALGKKFVDGVSEVAAYGDAIDKNSQKMGISAQAYQEWDFILQHSGSSIDAMSRGMMTLSKQAASNSDAFKKLGITQKDLATLNKEDLFAKTIEGLQALGEGTKRDALANELFGGSAKELGPLLNTSAEDVAAMREQVNELGGVMGDDAVKDAAAFQDALQNLQTAFGGIEKAFTSQFLPSFTSVLDGLTDIFSGDSAGGVAKISDGLTEIINTLSDKAPEFLDVGFRIIESIGMSITENLPSLIERGSDLLLNGILPGIISNLPAIVETAFTVLAQFVSAIGQALPTLIPAAVEMVIQIVESLLDNIDLLIDAAIQLVLGLVQGISNAIPVLLSKAPEIIEKLVSALIRNLPKLIAMAPQLIMSLIQGLISALPDLLLMGPQIILSIINGIIGAFKDLFGTGKDMIQQVGEGIKSAISNAAQWGKDLIINFWNGIKSKLDWLWDGVKGIGQGIADFLGFSEPKKGPLSRFHTFAPDMMELFMKGIRDNEGKLTDTVANAFDFRDAMTGPEYNGGFAFAGAGGYSGGMPTIDLLIDGKTLVGSTREHSDRSFGEMEKIRARWDGDQNEH